MEVGDDPRPVRIEPEAQDPQPARRHRLDHPAFVGWSRVEHEEPAAARAHELAADRAGGPRGLVVLVEEAVGHLRRVHANSRRCRSRRNRSGPHHQPPSGADHGVGAEGLERRRQRPALSESAARA